MKKILFKVVGVLTIIFAIWIMFVGFETSYETLCIVIGTLLLTFGCVSFMFSSDKAYNDSVSSVKKMTNVRGIKVVDFYNAFKDCKSILGAPWLGKIKLVKGNALIFGPTQNGDYLYLHKMFGSFFLAHNPIPSWIVGPKEELWRLDATANDFNIFSDEDLVCYSMLAQSAIDDVFASLQKFSETGVAMPFPNDQRLGKVYRFDESFKLTGQKFYLTDYDGNPLYEIESNFPLKNFYMRDVKTNTEVFKITKRLLHLLDHYDFYLNGNEYGSFEQKMDIMYDKFVMETPDGTFEMKNVNDKIGTNYIIKLNETVIATIAERFNLTAHNIVFDNFVLHVRDDRHLPLVTAMAVMAARELQRDRQN